MNSRWQANKIGLINFWYYDEQEFPFAKGRMLLRGANGSGKSVTMQSIIPLLLDGNMSPERLDPFRSRDRKMISYLLDEEDDREERTGYLYLEFRREESDTYLTVGMGIRARKGKPLDKWYFSLSDGRRVGRDFFLYRETGEKIPLSKKELENRIQDGGMVFERQADYMEYVNRQVFGFETAEEYEELIDLLIQLRTPKLSRDFKPSVINEILSDSLQPLSDEDLRPMSEAIENMDAMNMNLRDRQEGKQAAEKISRVLNQYNSLVLYEKASNYEEARLRLETLEGERAGRQEMIREGEAEAARLEEERVSLDARREAMEKERDSLSQSDAVGLKQKELELEAEIREKEKILEEKTGQLGLKEEAGRDTARRQKETEQRRDQKQEELYGLLDEMAEDAEEMAFEDHAFFSAELKERFQSACDFQSHQQLLDRTSQAIEKGTELLREAESRQRQMDERMLEREREQRQIDSAQKKVAELEGLLTQTRNEWKEALYSWNGKNQELVLEPELLRRLSQFAEEYGEQSDFTRVRDAVGDVWLNRKNQLTQLLSQTNASLEALAAEYEEQRRQLEEWENHREPEPPRSDSVIRSRERLRELGIPFREFYKMLEFGPELDQEACGRLEEALLEMGILDALVVEEQYREQVLKLTPGCSDRYLFMQRQRAEKSLLDVLDLNDTVNDIFSNQRITAVLENIAYEGPGITAVAADGTYQIGVLSGTVTGEYEAGFLGSRARERNRLARIAECRRAMAELDSRRRELEQEGKELERRIGCLREEYDGLPGDQDLRVNWQMLRNAAEELGQMQARARKLEEQIREMAQALKELRARALQIAEKLYLACRFDVFEKAGRAARAYQNKFYQLRSGHEVYLQLSAVLEELGRRMEELEADMDQIRYDMGRTERGLKRNREEYQSVQEQLKLTDYEAVRERLDACVRWLGEYPLRLKNCVEQQAGRLEQVKNLRGQIEAGEELIREAARKKEYLGRCYEGELALGYVELPENLRGQGTAGAGAVKAFLSPETLRVQRNSVIQSLNQVYFENRGFLNDYQPSQTELFGELEAEGCPGDPPAKRLDIQARYQGVKIPFHQLTAHLEEEILRLQELIKDGDRELFEDILANTVSRKIRGKINSSNSWVDKMNSLMKGMNTSSGLRLSLRWRSRTAETENQLDTRELVELLKKDYRLMLPEEAERLSRHFRSKVEEARRRAADSGGMISFYQVMKETLDYRKWFEFQLFSQKTGERQKELTNSVFGTFSGGEKAMAMYVPLFSAVAAKYEGGRADAPRLIALDEAFAGVDSRNIRDMFRLMTEFGFNYMMNSQVLWGDCDTVDALAIYQLARPENARFVMVMPYLWNGKGREMLEREGEVEERAGQLAGR